MHFSLPANVKPLMSWFGCCENVGRIMQDHGARGVNCEGGVGGGGQGSAGADSSDAGSSQGSFEYMVGFRGGQPDIPVFPKIRSTCCPACYGLHRGCGVQLHLISAGRKIIKGCTIPFGTSTKPSSLEFLQLCMSVAAVAAKAAACGKAVVCLLCLLLVSSDTWNLCMLGKSIC